MVQARVPVVTLGEQITQQKSYFEEAASGNQCDYEQCFLQSLVASSLKIIGELRLGSPHLT